MGKKHLTKSRILSLRCRQYTVMQGGGVYGTPGETSTPPLPKPDCSHRNARLRHEPLGSDASTKKLKGTKSLGVGHQNSGTLWNQRFQNHAKATSIGVMITALFAMLAYLRAFLIPRHRRAMEAVDVAATFALRWSDVDFDKAVLTISRSLAQTRQEGIYLKCPKSGRTRTFALPSSCVEQLRAFEQVQRSRAEQFGASYRLDL